MQSLIDVGDYNHHSWVPNFGNGEIKVLGTLDQSIRYENSSNASTNVCLKTVELQDSCSMFWAQLNNSSMKR